MSKKNNKKRWSLHVYDNLDPPPPHPGQTRTVVNDRIRSRRNTIVILDHVIRQKTVVYGRKWPYTECVNRDLGIFMTRR